EQRDLVLHGAQLHVHLLVLLLLRFCRQLSSFLRSVILRMSFSVMSADSATSRGTDGLAASVRSPCSAAATAFSSTRTSSLSSATAWSASGARRNTECAKLA